VDAKQTRAALADLSALGHVTRHRQTSGRPSTYTPTSLAPAGRSALVTLTTVHALRDRTPVERRGWLLASALRSYTSDLVRADEWTEHMVGCGHHRGTADRVARVLLGETLFQPDEDESRGGLCASRGGPGAVTRWSWRVAPLLTPGSPTPPTHSRSTDVEPVDDEQMIRDLLEHPPQVTQPMLREHRQYANECLRQYALTDAADDHGGWDGHLSDEGWPSWCAPLFHPLVVLLDRHPNADSDTVVEWLTLIDASDETYLARRYPHLPRRRRRAVMEADEALYRARAAAVADLVEPF